MGCIMFPQEQVAILYLSLTAQMTHFYNNMRSSSASIGFVSHLMEDGEPFNGDRLFAPTLA